MATFNSAYVSRSQNVAKGRGIGGETTSKIPIIITKDLLQGSAPTMPVVLTCSDGMVIAHRAFLAQWSPRHGISFTTFLLPAIASWYSTVLFTILRYPKKKGSNMIQFDKQFFCFRKPRFYPMTLLKEGWCE
jgi:hypothetical protein